MQTLRHVLWIGGPPGGGKSSVATRIARRYGLPYRCGGGLCSSNALDVQAAAETTNTLCATMLGGCDLVVWRVFQVVHSFGVEDRVG